MADQRHFEPAAQSRAMDRGHDRLRRGLDDFLHFEQGRAFRRLAEFADIGAGDEGLAGADQHDRLDRIIGDGGLEAGFQPLAHRCRQCIHRRRVQGQDGDLAVDGEIGYRIDGCHGLPSASCFSGRLRAGGRFRWSNSTTPHFSLVDLIIMGCPLFSRTGDGGIVGDRRSDMRAICPAAGDVVE
jgi:hypothetical protein